MLRLEQWLWVYKSAPALVQLLLGALDKIGDADIVRQSLQEVQEECRSIHGWYTHRGQYNEGTLPKVIEAKSTATIKFIKAKNNFLGI